MAKSAKITTDSKPDSKAKESSSGTQEKKQSNSTKSRSKQPLPVYNTNEGKRLLEANWKKWGPYVSDRHWGTVREDYSAEGDAWRSTTHDMARSKAWRWGEEAIGGICDNMQHLCFGWAFWNGKDAILKERYFGLSNYEGNHGEDVKELYYYLDNTPTHSYMKMLYKYPFAAFPYEQLLEENAKRTHKDPEFEILDTGVLDNGRYFDIQIEYAKNEPEDILIRLTVTNKSADTTAQLHILPTLWFRNDWTWDLQPNKPSILNAGLHQLTLFKDVLGEYQFYTAPTGALLFCDNETNNKKLYASENDSQYVKDGINDFIIHGNKESINNTKGTKAAIHMQVTLEAGAQNTYRFRLSKTPLSGPFKDFDDIFLQRVKQADEYYHSLQDLVPNDEERLIQRQALAGMLWSKQFYHYNVSKWLQGDPGTPPPPKQREQGRNSGWQHVDNLNIISMPDKWEYPWYATWDLAFHAVNFAMIDSKFAKNQLKIITHEWYMHANGQLPAYEWDFGNVNPPVHAWATWRVYKIDEKNHGKPDTDFLKLVYHKLLLNFTWWVNRKDAEKNNVFEGGFLGLDNIGVFDRNDAVANGVQLEQSDATAWMAMFALNMMRIALELCKTDIVYQDMASKFFEHFLSIAYAMENVKAGGDGLWDEEDEFYYDQIHSKYGESIRLKLRSIVGIIPLFAVEVIDEASLQQAPLFIKRMNWIYENKPELASLVSRWKEQNNTLHLLSLLRGHRMKKILQRMLDENEFLSDYGVRSVSKYHKDHPYVLKIGNLIYNVAYTPGESDSNMFGGNSNWRGPIWMPINFLIIESLQRFHYYYGEDFKVECPTGSGQYLTILEIAEFLAGRNLQLFAKDQDGKRAFLNGDEKQQNDPDFNQYILFHEYFHGDTGKGLGASHQTGWTGIIAKMIQSKYNQKKK
ncbi:Glycosyl hydrolase family 63 C-terminal domain-containing protein [Arachidicoccus rhizosphaerae]|uniref:Glycosyl hydrolase family 63 C-terminal domain-containing protein n=1 Tax=Arachidicoccus rhizosphaerae TaxID=551991 RepID=A0A1H3WLU9_9BACT|nr:glucosidase [Arachidicoccus rhizosphaerae]SDZ87344.1 Glycosyl hydrolase family 63 C-terminal domain-containing protein [Arachidicoccus rhizosphaerae]